MEGNGQHEVASFGWTQTKILQGLEAEGHNLNDVTVLREKVAGVNEILQAFHTKHRALRDSGKYTQAGLQEAASELAAVAAGEIRRLLDDRHLRENIRQTREKLRRQESGDSAEALMGFWKMMEIRQMYQQLGLVLLNPNTGELAPDTVKASLAYQEALARRDAVTQEALETWPLLEGKLIPPELAEQGRAQRQEALDPVNSQKLRELERFQREMARITKDALQELPLAQPDPIAEQAAGS